MKTTYNEILERMKNAFFEKCGENVDLMSDLGARFQAVASELFSLSCFNEFVLKQAFPQTASGEYLDSHAALRSITRKTASKAFGELTFYADENNQSNIEIPKGTVCSVEGAPYIQFETNENALIPSGECSVTVQATALEAGEQYNAKEGTVCIMVNPPTSVISVTNEKDFIGGWNEESDEQLRKRILSSYAIPQTGVSVKSLEETVLKFEDVLDCNIIVGNNSSLLVFIKTKSSSISVNLLNQLDNALMIAEMASLQVIISPAECVTYDLIIDVEASGSKDKIISAVKEYTDSLRIGESLSLSRVTNIALKASDGAFCEVGCPTASNGVITARNFEYLKLSEITVNCYE